MHSLRGMLYASLLLVSAGCDGGPGATMPGTDAGVTPRRDAGPPRDAGPRPDAGPPGPGPLMDLPSVEGPHVATIRALGDDAWVQLPAPAGDPTFGAAPGRSWGGRAFAWAPDLGGAFLYGEGPHAHVRADGFANDELWVYDVNGNRWITVHPGTDIATFSSRVRSGELRLDDDLQLVDASGEPQPVHVLIHAWGYLTYDPDRRAFTFFAGRGLGTYFLPGWEDGAGPMAEGISLLEAQEMGRSEPVMSPWTYEVTTGRFARSRASGEYYDTGTDFPLFVYASAERKLVLAGRGGVSVFDPATRTWTVASDTGPRPTGYDHGGCYDPVRNRLYLGNGSDESRMGLYTYDVATSTWTAPTGGPSASFGTNAAAVQYDPVADAVVVISRADRTVYAYDLTSETWSMRPFPASVEYSSYASMNGFYAPELNAYLLYFAVDGEPDGEVWAYRYRRAP